ncbi:Condensin-2 Complex Subunit D3 [Manis pentadactyla]|nr:Condensin-2 Complex Subunit D3 [Manis pentadactyla]
MGPSGVGVDGCRLPGMKPLQRAPGDLPQRNQPPPGSPVGSPACLQHISCPARDAGPDRLPASLALASRPCSALSYANHPAGRLPPPPQPRRLPQREEGVAA